MKLGLESIRSLLSALGDPQRNYPKIQVAGTNGKGSVCGFVDSICRAAGVHVGLFTSPHLVAITERVRIDGEDINEDDFALLATQVREVAEQLVASGKLASAPTFFEQITALALLAFADSKIEIAILETGLGGRLDATTAANAEICAITRVDLDHQQYLGDTIKEIAAEKAAIIHEGSRVVIGEQGHEAMKVLLDRCRKLAIEPLLAEGSPDMSLGLKGQHQTENAAIAISLANELRAFTPISDRDIARGLAAARHPGRLEYQGRYLFDGAHNPGGAKALRAFLDEFERRPITLVFGAMEDKPVGEILGLLIPPAAKIVFTEPSNERAVSYQTLLDAKPSGMSNEKTFVTDSVEKAIHIANTITPEDGLILVTSSLYIVGEVKRLHASQI